VQWAEPGRWQALVPALWAGALVAVAAVATPAPFATLPAAEAGRVVARVLAVEAHASLALGALVLVLERLAARRAAASGPAPQFSTGMVLALVALFCTVVGYFALQPQMAAARAGQGALSFAALHGLSTVLFGAKLACVLALAWRNAGAAVSRRPSS
jgi:hypothetical protein